MTSVLKSRKAGWEALKAGTYIQDYANEIMSKDTRTSLQKAIDKYDPNINIVRKKNIEDGDLQMLTPDGWEQFCIHKASRQINEKGMFVFIRRMVAGIWVSYNHDDLYTFNHSIDLREKDHDYIDVQGYKIEQSKKFVNINKHPIYGWETETEYYSKLFRQDRELAANEY